jgi:hypothetical protein
MVETQKVLSLIVIKHNPNCTKLLYWDTVHTVEHQALILWEIQLPDCVHLAL